jgi:hypothetical protein
VKALKEHIKLLQAEMKNLQKELKSSYHQVTTIKLKTAGPFVAELQVKDALIA